MENNTETKQDCGCNGDCCQPKKGKIWTKMIFFIIVTAAIAIVTFKLFINNIKAEPKAKTVSKEQPACCDTTKPNMFIQISDPNKNQPCCPKVKK